MLCIYVPKFRYLALEGDRNYAAKQKDAELPQVRLSPLISGSSHVLPRLATIRRPCAARTPVGFPHLQLVQDISITSSLLRSAFRKALGWLVFSF